MEREWSDTLSLIWHSIFGLLGFLLNFILLVVTMRKTPSSMYNYAILIRVSIFFDLLMSIAIFMTTLRLLPASSSIFALFQGPCTQCFSGFNTSRFCFYMYALQVNCQIASHFMLIFSYYYRQRVVTMPFDKFNNAHLQIIYYFYSLTSIIFFNLVYYTALSSKEDIDRKAAELFPELIGSDWVYSAVLNLNDPIQRIFNILSIYTARVTIFVASVCWYRVSRAIRTMQVSSYSKTLHKSLLNVLVFQTISPFLSTGTALIFTISIYFPEFRTTTTQNLMTLPSGLMAVFSAFCSFYFIAPYRTAVKNMLRMTEHIPSSVHTTTGVF